MQELIKKIYQEISDFEILSLDNVEQFRIKYLSKSGKISKLFNTFSSFDKEHKKVFGKELNELKNFAQNKLKTSKDQYGSVELEEKIDLTRPVIPTLGSQHPLSVVRQQVISFFEKYGFNISEGSEMVSDWENFSALNFEKDHPARDMQDTFYLDDESILRTHTSSVQVNQMELGLLPIRTISPGRVFRNEKISSRSHIQFHQLEGLYIDKNVSFADLKQILYLFVQDFFGQDTKIRFRSSYFPFTEVSAEMDISCGICEQKGCAVCKTTGWVEILGCGMVDPKVLENCGIDSQKYSGYAFGFGIERLAMLKFGIKDIRMFYENDVRFLSQFKTF